MRVAVVAPAEHDQPVTAVRREFGNAVHARIERRRRSALEPRDDATLDEVRKLVRIRAHFQTARFFEFFTGGM